MHIFGRAGLFVAVLAMAASAVAGRATAGTVYGLDYFNAGPGGTTTPASSPYVTVDVSGDTSTGDVTFVVTSIGASNLNGDFGFNASKVVHEALTATTTSINLVSINGSAPSSIYSFKTGSYQMDGFKDFDFGIDRSSSNSSRLNTNTYVIQLSDKSLATAANFAVVGSTGKNPTSFYFGTHYYPKGSGTGYAAGKTLSAVPEPATLISTGLAAAAGLALAARRRRAS